MKTCNCELFFARHGESEFNIGIHGIDSPLTVKGIGQAKLLKGEFDLIICSPLKRCRQTLEFSNFTYQHLEISYLFRERVCDDSTMTEEEHCSYRGYQEPFDIFNSRINKFEKELEKRCKEYNKI